MSRTFKAAVKQVPDSAPNDEGQWIIVEVDQKLWKGYHINTFEYLTTLCAAGHHAVQYKALESDV